MPREWWEPLPECVKTCFLNALEAQRKYHEESNRYYSETIDLKLKVTRLEKKLKELEQQLILKQKELEAARRAEKRQAAPKEEPTSTWSSARARASLPA